MRKKETMKIMAKKRGNNLENLILSVNVVLPLFLIMAAGYLCKILKLYDMKSHAVMNKLVFRLFLPVLLFKNIYTTSLSADIDWNVFIFATISVLIMFGLLFAVIPLIEKDNKRRGVLIQGIGRSNFVLFGIPMAEMLCGGELAVTSLLVAVVIPMFNVLSVIALEVFRGGKINVKKIVLGIAKNPLIISSLLGLLLLLLDFRFPAAIDEAIIDMSGIATPFALFLLGGAMEFSKVGKNLRPLMIGVVGKLIAMPAIFVTAAVLCGFRGIELVSMTVLFMSPSAVSSYTMAQQMDADGELAGQQVVFSTAFSIISIFLIVLLMKTIGLI